MINGSFFSGSGTEKLWFARLYSISTYAAVSTSIIIFFLSLVSCTLLILMPSIAGSKSRRNSLGSYPVLDSTISLCTGFGMFDVGPLAVFLAKVSCLSGCSSTLVVSFWISAITFVIASGLSFIALLALSKASFDFAACAVSSRLIFDIAENWRRRLQGQGKPSIRLTRLPARRPSVD